LDEININNFERKTDEKIQKNMEIYAVFLNKTKRFIRNIKFNITNIFNKKRKWD